MEEEGIKIIVVTFVVAIGIIIVLLKVISHFAGGRSSLTKNAVKNGGEILFLAACPNGIGEEQTMENFYNLLTAPIDRILKSVESEYKLFSHKPYKLARLLQRLRQIWMYSEIPDELIETMHLHPAHQPQKVVDNWLAEDPAAKITIVDGANKIALYPKT
jgi:nickel-dependent lactate racemase